ncbi:hypothetical protein LOTGIDRAFT_175901 [Lottia gigantea]|uniref:Mutator-like transposase domain-containing protein n=1 Tax=Lottia gigantea TaxID=225164 RepID=V4A4M2_LOTGI|nr:hypothetical protein LOTGIDRAFT_175901 [Lottia gigantea]ESO88216.1 hypothetical protein LOTGIDRAFT_175901 [Lottia gigantea]
MPLGNSRTRLLLADLDIPPPAESGMSKLSSYVSSKTTDLNNESMRTKVEEVNNESMRTKVEEVNNESMRTKVEEVKNVNRRRGASNPNVINVALDGRYNCLTIGHSKKPRQGASQSIGIACETNTDKKYIISAVLQNKLCWTGAWLRNTGITVNCPGHEGCTANLTRHAPLSEREMGRIIGEDLSIQGVLIKFATTDGDSTSATRIEEAM